MMSKKHYESIALLLNAQYEMHKREAESRNEAEALIGMGGKIALKHMGRSLAELFARDNPRFQRNRFFMAAFGHLPLGADSAAEQREQEAASTAFGATLKNALKRR